MTEQEKPSLLIYNQFPRIWNMDFGLMKAYLRVIKELGFNVVWVNPFMKTSKHNVVVRKNKLSQEEIKAIKSLYGMFDPSLIYTETYSEDSLGDPSSTNYQSEKAISAYTQEAKSLELIPIFDLVLNHVSKDSPLVAGTFKHFLNLGIDTSEWFQKNTGTKWNDIVPFDYNKKDNVEQIFEHLWKPFIFKMIKIYGFQGVRIDYATGPQVNEKIIKKCIDYIKQLAPKAIIFAEDLYKGSREDRDRDGLSRFEDVGFTHATNIAMFFPEASIRTETSKESPIGYEGIRENLGLKKLMTYSDDNIEFRKGTIGFPGSHDTGPSLLAWRSITGEELPSSQEEKLILAKKRMAIAAFTSDAGWYLLAGDEILSEVMKSPFVRQDDSSFEKDADKELNILTSLASSAPFPSLDKTPEKYPEIFPFIKNINSTFSKLRPAPEIFWFEVFSDSTRNIIYFIRHLGEGRETPTDIVAVNLSEKDFHLKDEALLTYLKEKCHAEIESKDIKYFYIS